MHSLRKKVVVWLGVLTLLAVMTAPAASHTLVGPSGKRRGHGCGQNVPGQTNPPHRTHKHRHGGMHHGRDHDERHKHFHRHRCPPYPPQNGDPDDDSVNSNFSGFERKAEEPGGVITVGVLLIAGLGLFTVLVASRAVRRRVGR